MKGKLNKASILVKHFEFKKSVIASGEEEFPKFFTRTKVPSFAVTINDKNEATYTTFGEFRIVTPRYIIFLKTDQVGNYIPASGQKFARMSFHRVLGNY